MSLSLWFSRHLRLRNGSGTDIGAFVAVIGVALAVIVLELTVGITLGFKDEIRRKLIGFDAQITVLPLYNSNLGTTEPTLDLKSDIVEIIKSTLPDAELRGSIRQPSILKTDSDFYGVILHSSEYIKSSRDSYDFEKSNIVEGIWPDFENHENNSDIVISEVMAKSLGLNVGDKIYSNFFVDSNIKSRRHTVAGIYNSNFHDFDTNVAYVSPVLLKSVLDLDSTQYMRVDIRGLELNKMDVYTDLLNDAIQRGVFEGRLDGYYPISNVEKSDALYFNWLSLIDTNVVVVFVLMFLIGGFTIISSLFILILENISQIGILRALGAEMKLISRIFVWMALKLVGMGILVGNIIGLTLLITQYYFHYIPLNPEMYYLDYVPVEMDWFAFAMITIGVILLSWVILVLPSRLVSKIDPSRTMQYE